MKKFLKVVIATFIGSLLTLLIGGFIFLSIVGSMLTFDTQKSVSVMPGSILKIDFKGYTIADKGNDDPFAGILAGSLNTDKTLSLMKVTDAINAAAYDPNIKFIYINTDYFNQSLAVTEEMRRAIDNFRSSGKAVIAYADSYSQPAYYLASAADKVYINPYGLIPMTGLSSNMMFFKDLLDKAGIQIQLVRHGKFKAAAEQYVRSDMSAENREQISRYLNSIWGTMTSSISEAREIEGAELNRMIDEFSIGTAKSALEAGIVDSLMYADQLGSQLCKLAGAENESDLRFISLDDYITSNENLKKQSKDRVAVLYASGNIVSGNDDSQIASGDFVKTISDIRKDKNVKAVVMRVNSPGGDAQAAEAIARELRLLREEKPLVVSFGDYAASGGYWISAESDYIFTNRTTLTGSIGVFGMIPNFGKALDKHLHINVETVNTNKNSDLLNTTRALNPAEEKFLTANIENVYERFLKLVSDGRGLSVQGVDSIAQGRVWTGEDALSIGLADEYGGLEDAIRYAAAKAGLGENYSITEYPRVKTSAERIFEMLNTASVMTEAVSEPEKALEKIIGTTSGKMTVMASLPFRMTQAK